MVGCDTWCKEAMDAAFSAPPPSRGTPRSVGMVCRRKKFHTTTAIYTRLLRQRDEGKISNHQAREELLKTETSAGSSVFTCKEGL